MRYIISSSRTGPALVFKETRLLYRRNHKNVVKFKKGCDAPPAMMLEYVYFDFSPFCTDAPRALPRGVLQSPGRHRFCGSVLIRNKIVRHSAFSMRVTSDSDSAFSIKMTSDSAFPILRIFHPTLGRSFRLAQPEIPAWRRLQFKRRTFHVQNRMDIVQAQNFLHLFFMYFVVTL